VTVWVDDMFKYPMGQFRRMKMSHLIADTDEELEKMARTIGLKKKWRHNDHYDVSLTMRAWAIAHGAKECTLRELAIMVANKRAGYPLGTPKTCVAISQRRVKAAMIARELIGKETGR
jgi:Protein of unknown function (DUF4031)